MASEEIESAEHEEVITYGRRRREEEIEEKAALSGDRGVNRSMAPEESGGKEE